jgi:Zn-dependent protease/CBS domain-containing protein
MPLDPTATPGRRWKRGAGPTAPRNETKKVVAVRQTIHLGRIRGIPVGAHWSVLLILLLLAESLALSLLPTVADGYPSGVYWFTAAWLAALFLATLVAHELAHALTAQHFGITVASVTLWALGGVSTLDDQPRHPRAELLTALAGPAASLVAAALFGLATIPAAITGSELVHAGLTWLAAANVALAIFNLLPGAPLDGGRVLSATLWWAGRDRDAARHTAAQAGGVLGLLLVATGVLLVLGFASFEGLWLVILGWYLNHAARTEDAAADLAGHLRGVLVGDAMSAPVVCGHAWHTVSEFVARTAGFCPHRVYPVIGIDGRLTGLLAVANLAAVPPRQRMTTAIGQVMTPASRIRTTTADTPLLDVIGALGNPLRTLVVVEQDRPCGVLTAGDVQRLAAVAQLGGLTRGLPTSGPAT